MSYQMILLISWFSSKSFSLPVFCSQIYVSCITNYFSVSYCSVCVLLDVSILFTLCGVAFRTSDWLAQLSELVIFAGRFVCRILQLCSYVPMSSYVPYAIPYAHYYEYT